MKDMWRLLKALAICSVFLLAFQSSTTAYSKTIYLGTAKTDCVNEYIHSPIRNGDELTFKFRITTSAKYVNVKVWTGGFFGDIEVRMKDKYGYVDSAEGDDPFIRFKNYDNSYEFTLEVKVNSTGWFFDTDKLIIQIKPRKWW